MRCGLEIDRDTGNIIREGCGSCVVKVWHKPDPYTGKGGHFTEPIDKHDLEPEDQAHIDSIKQEINGTNQTSDRKD
jgi:hypothetical protein